MTIGTSIMFGSFTFTCHTPASTTCFVCGEDRKWSALCGLVIQKIEGLLVADSIPDSIERPIACQTCPDRLRSLFRLRRERFYLTIDFLVANLDLFLVRDLSSSSEAFTSCTACSRCPARRRLKSIFFISSARMPCDASARNPRSRRTSIWCSTSASGTSNSFASPAPQPVCPWPRARRCASSPPPCFRGYASALRRLW